MICEVAVPTSMPTLVSVIVSSFQSGCSVSSSWSWSWRMSCMMWPSDCHRASLFCDAANIFHHEGQEAKRAGFKPAPTNPNFFANFAWCKFLRIRSGQAFAAKSFLRFGCDYATSPCSSRKKALALSAPASPVHHGTMFFILQVMPRLLSSASKI